MREALRRGWDGRGMPQVSRVLSLTAEVTLWSLDGCFWALCSLFWGYKVAGRAREVLWLAHSNLSPLHFHSFKG